MLLNVPHPPDHAPPGRSASKSAREDREGLPVPKSRALEATAGTVAEAIEVYTRPTTSDALWPPNPKLLLIATSTFASRGTFGV